MRPTALLTQSYAVESAVGSAQTLPEARSSEGASHHMQGVTTLTGQRYTIDQYPRGKFYFRLVGA